MADHDFKPFVPASTSMAELSLKAMVLGIIMAIALGAANAYVGMRAGLTVAATFQPGPDGAAVALEVHGERYDYSLVEYSGRP